MKNHLTKIVSGIIVAGLVSSAIAQVVEFDIADLTTVPSMDTDNNGFNNNGIWFTMTNGTPLVISDDSFPGYADGQFQLRTGDYINDAAEFLTQGFFANGNDVAVNLASIFPANPAYIPFGQSVGPDSDFGGSTAFVAMSGDFGNWINSDSLRGALGVKFANGANIHYGFADVTVFANGIATLHGYAYESTPGLAISTYAIPEPSTYVAWAGALVFAGLLIRRRLGK